MPNALMTGSLWRDPRASPNKLAPGTGADAKMDRRAIAVDETMDRVSAVDKTVLSNHRHAKDEIVQNSFHSPLLQVAEIELMDKKLQQFAVHPTTVRIAVYLLVRPGERSRRRSWPRNASTVVWEIRYPGKRLSCCPT